MSLLQNPIIRTMAHKNQNFTSQINKLNFRKIQTITEFVRKIVRAMKLKCIISLQDKLTIKKTKISSRIIKIIRNQLKGGHSLNEKPIYYKNSV